MRRIIKRVFYALFATFIVGFTIWGYTLTKSDGSSSSLQTITIGYQAGDPISISKARGQLVKEMKKKGYRVVFKEFQNGAAEMEAMSSGTIDFARTGDTPPITALASGNKVTIVATGSSKAQGSGIVVSKNSGIKSIKDLKGKKIAYTSNTSSQYMVLKVLKKAGLTSSDVKLVDMSQSAAAVAFAKGKIAAWANWDPYTAQAELKYDGLMIVNGSDVNVTNRDYLLSGKYAGNHKSATKLLIKYLSKDMTWAKTHKTALISMMSKELKLSKAIIARQVNRRSFAMHAVGSTQVAEEQAITDLFYQQGVIKKTIDISKYVLNLK